MDTVISAWGNSLGMRIPKSYAKELGLKKGTRVELTSEKDKLIVRKVPSGNKAYDLKSLVRGITPENRYKEIHTGQRVGGETW